MYNVSFIYILYSNQWPVAEKWTKKPHYFTQLCHSPAKFLQVPFLTSELRELEIFKNYSESDIQNLLTKSRLQCHMDMNKAVKNSTEFSSKSYHSVLNLAKNADKYDAVKLEAFRVFFGYGGDLFRMIFNAAQGGDFVIYSYKSSMIF